MAGANKPDGKNPKQRVAFTRRDADRIARVVRTVEQGDRKGTPLTFGQRLRPVVASASTATITTATITVVTGAILSTTALTLTRSNIVVVSSETAGSQLISVYNCPGAVVSAESQAFYYG